MALFDEVTQKIAAKRLARRLNDRFPQKTVTRSGVVVGETTVSIDGRMYNADVKGYARGTVLDLANVGRPAAALYVPTNAATGGGSGGSGGSSGGDGSTPPTDLTPYMRRDGSLAMLGNLNMGARNITNVALVDDRDVSADGATLDSIRAAAIITVGGDATLTADRALTVTTGLTINDGGAGNNVTIGLATPGQLSAITLNNPFGAHTHEILASDSPGAAVAILKSTAAGNLTLPTFTATTTVRTPQISTSSGALAIVPFSSQTNVTGTLTASVTLVANTSVRTPLITTATNVDLTIDPAGTGAVVFPTAQKIRSSVFDSSFPIAGWQINESLTVAGRSVLTIGEINADELRTKVFVADETRVDRGNQFWTKSYGILAEDFTTPSAIGGTTTAIFEDSPALAGAIFSVNDWLLFRKVDVSSGLTVASAWGQVSNYVNLGSGKQSWTFTLRQGPTSTKMAKGQTSVDFGQSGDALIHLSVLDSAGAPYIKMRRWVGANPYTPANFTTYVQLGHLGSIGNPLYTPAGYGLYVSSSSSNSKFIVADDNGLQIRGADFSAYNGANQTVLISSANGSVKLGTNIANPVTTSFEFNGTTGALDLRGNFSAINGQVTANTYGLNIGVTVGDAIWTQYDKKLTFTENPAAPTKANTVGQLYATRRTESTLDVYDMVFLQSKSGAGYGADWSYVEIGATHDSGGFYLGLAEVRAIADGTDNRVELWAEATGPGRGNIYLYAFANTEHIRPTFDLQWNIGEANRRYSHAYIDQLHVGSIVGTPSYAHNHAAGDITSGVFSLTLIPSVLTGKDADTLDGYHASAFMLSSSGTGFVPTSRTISAGAGLTGGGNLGSNITLSHADTSAQVSLDLSGGMAIQDVTVDTYGHVTFLGYVDFDGRFMRTVTQGSGITVTGTAPTITVSHANTTTETSEINSGQSFIQSVYLDSFGHVITITSGNIGSALDGRYVNITGDVMTGGLSILAALNVSGTTTLDGTLATNGNVFMAGLLTANGPTIFQGTVSFNPFTVSAPFVLSGSAQGQTVIGLKADQLNKSVSSGSGLIGGGTLDANRALSVDLSYAFTWAAQHAFAPSAAQAPFTLGMNARSQLVVGLRADELNKAVTPGDGLTGGGFLTSNVSLSVDATVARRNAANVFTQNQTIMVPVAPALIFDNGTNDWAIVGTSVALLFSLDNVTKFAIGASGNIDFSGGLTVDGDTLYVSATNDSVWINSGTPDGLTTFKVTGADAGDTVAAFRAATGQTGYIWRVENESGGGLLGVDAFGNLQSIATGFVSGRSGWRISPDGTAEFNNIIARGEIRTAVFTKNEIAVDTGSHLFAEAGLTRSEFVVGTGNLQLDIVDPAHTHDRIFSVGDNLLIRTHAARNYAAVAGNNIVSPALWWFPRIPINLQVIASQTWLKVTAATDMGTFWRYTVQHKGGAYATYPQNTTVVSYGQGTTGLLGIFADQQYGPYLDVFLPGPTPWDTIPRTTVRLGRLDGLGLPELAVEQYGIAIGTDLADPASSRIIASNLQFTMQNVSLTIKNAAGYSDIQFALNADSYFGQFFYDYETNSSRIGVSDNSRIEYTISPTAAFPNQFFMIGSYSFLPYDNFVGDSVGALTVQLPLTYTYDDGLTTGWMLGTGSFNNPDRAIKLWWVNSTAYRMAGIFDGAEVWSVTHRGIWSFAEDSVRISTNGIELAAVDNDTTLIKEQFYWRLPAPSPEIAGEVIATMAGYRSNIDENTLRIQAQSNGPTPSQIELWSRTGYEASLIRLWTDEDTSHIYIGSEAIEIDGVVTLNKALFLTAITDPGTPPTGKAVMWIDSTSGDLQIRFANGVMRVLALN